MQCSRLALAGCIATVIGSAALSAQTTSPRPQRPAADQPARLLVQPSTPIDPVFEQRLADQLRSGSRLFAQTGPEGGPGLRQKAPTPSLAPRQICGIKVLPADSSIDPKFESPLHDTKTQFAIRTVPVLCR
jgi:hypothetical protein